MDEETIKKGMDQYLSAKYKNVTPAAIPQGPQEPSESLPENQVEIMAIDPLPPAQQGRKVVISQRSKAATTSGRYGLHTWNLDFKNQERWSNPLMGWTSTGDPMSNLSLKFDTPEQAVHFCKKRGWDYEVKLPLQSEQVLGATKYAHNFLPMDIEREIKVKKTESKHFAFPTVGASHYLRPLNFHGTGQVRQHGNPEAAVSEQK
ncbi:unnamed protein product [Choristocarpus tenellus]